MSLICFVLCFILFFVLFCESHKQTINHLFCYYFCFCFECFLSHCFVLCFILFFLFCFLSHKQRHFCSIVLENNSSLSHEHFSKDLHGSGIWEKYSCMMLSRFSLLHPFESVTKPQKHRHYNPNTENGCLKNVANIFHIL